MAGSMKGNANEMIVRINDLRDSLEYTDISVLRKLEPYLHLLRKSISKATNKINKEV